MNIIPPLPLDRIATSSTAGYEHHVRVNNSRLQLTGTYTIAYDNSKKAGIKLRNTTVHRFNDGIKRSIIDVESSSRDILDIVEGDVLVNINGIIVGKKNLLDVSIILKKIMDDYKTTKLTFLKTEIVSLSDYLNNASTITTNAKDMKSNNKSSNKINNNKINNDKINNDNDNDFEVIYQSDTLRCPRCKKNVNKEWKFCNQCGNNLTLTKPSMKALDFIEKVDRDNYLNKSAYSSIVIDNNNSSKINQYNDSIDDEYDDDNDNNTLSIDEEVLNAIDDRINSFNSDAYKKYKKKMVLAEMLADELELQNAEYVESAYVRMVNDYKKNDDGEMLDDFIV